MQSKTNNTLFFSWNILGNFDFQKGRFTSYTWDLFGSNKKEENEGLSKKTKWKVFSPYIQDRMGSKNKGLFTSWISEQLFSILLRITNAWNYEKDRLFL